MMGRVTLSFEDGAAFPQEQGTYLVKLANDIGRLSYALILFRTASEWAEDMADCSDDGDEVAGWCRLPDIPESEGTDTAQRTKSPRKEIGKMKKSEILKELITLAYDPDPDDIRITLADVLGLYADIVREEQSVLAVDVSGAKACVPPPNTPAPKKEAAPKAEAEQAETEQVETEQAEPAAFVGVGSLEKRESYARLLAYREANGVGCFAKLAQASDGALTAEDIRGMCGAGRYPLYKWRAVVTAIEKVENLREAM